MVKFTQEELDETADALFGHAFKELGGAARQIVKEQLTAEQQDQAASAHWDAVNGAGIMTQQAAQEATWLPFPTDER